MFQEPSQSQKDAFQQFFFPFLQYIEDETGFVPSLYRQHAGEEGAYDAVIAQILGGHIQYGFEPLYKRGYLRLTLEAVVLSEKWGRLFPEEVIKKARRRLKNYGYELK